VQGFFNNIMSFIANLYIRPLTHPNNIAASDKEKLCEKLATSNLLRLLVLAVVAFGIELILMFLSIFNVTQRPYEQAYFILTIVHCVCSFFFIPIIYYALNKGSTKFKRNIHRIYLLLFSLVTSVFMIVDILNSNSIDNYILMSGILLVIPVLSLLESFVYVFLYTGILTSFIIYNNNGHIMLLQIIIVGLSVIVISHVLYQSYANTFVSCLRIEEKNDELVKMNLQLQELSQTDALTSLLNRRGAQIKIEAVWEKCIEHKTNICFMFGDIDFFKAYNDTFGHDNGDECLKLISYCLKERARNQTDVVSRHGGEEFLLAFENISKSEAIGIAKRIKDSVESKKIPSANQQASIYVTISFGIFIASPNENNTIQSALKQADIALYKAKDSGRNVICFGEEIIK